MTVHLSFGKSIPVQCIVFFVVSVRLGVFLRVEVFLVSVLFVLLSWQAWYVEVI